MKTHGVCVTGLLPGLFDEDADASQAKRQKAIADHLDSLGICWPQWEGPKPGGDASVNSVSAYNMTHRCNRYHYMAPVRLLFQSGQWEWIAIIEYTGNTWCRCYTGDLLRLDILQIWAPCHKLIERIPQS